jgi:hypothetical protein
LRVSQDQKFCFYQEKASSVNEADLRDIFKKATKSGCTSTVVLSPDPFPLTSSTSSAVKTPVGTEEGPDDPEPADEGDIQMEYSDELYTPSVRAVAKIKKEFRSE